MNNVEMVNLVQSDGLTDRVSAGEHWIASEEWLTTFAGIEYPQQGDDLCTADRFVCTSDGMIITIRDLEGGIRTYDMGSQASHQARIDELNRLYYGGILGTTNQDMIENLKVESPEDVPNWMVLAGILGFTLFIASFRVVITRLRASKNITTIEEFINWERKGSAIDTDAPYESIQLSEESQYEELRRTLQGNLGLRAMRMTPNNGKIDWDSAIAVTMRMLQIDDKRLLRGEVVEVPKIDRSRGANDSISGLPVADKAQQEAKELYDYTDDSIFININSVDVKFRK